MFDVLIVGAGHAGAQLAIALRQAKFDGTIALVGDEPEFPYERPPLSKDYLSGEKSFERILIRQPGFWEERGITLLLGRRVTAVDPDGKTVTLPGEDSTLRYGTLVWATGGSPRRLDCSGHDLAGVHAVRTREDVDRLSAQLQTASRVVVIGGGYIGLEAAAVLSKLGKQVTVLEAQDRVLARVAGEALSRFYEGEHRAHGVDVRLCARVECIESLEGQVAGVRLADGEVLACDIVIVGIGVVPAIGPLEGTGVELGNGVVVDTHCRTNIPHIYAIGDCALHQNAFAGGAMVRVESVQNANDQAATVARAILGSPVPYYAAPWFWSNQYDLRLQTIGLSTGHDHAVVRGDMAGRSFAIVYLKEGRVIALDCVNATKDYVQGRALVLAGAMVDPLQLADPAVPLKVLA